MQMRISDSEAKQYFAIRNASFTGEYFKIKKRTIHYVVTGKNFLPTLVFIHGSPGSWKAFKEYLVDNSLQQHYRMISIDRPGFGYSDFGNALNLDDQASLISIFLTHIQNGRPICLVGYSFGGPLIIKLAANNHNLPIKNLVMIAGPVDPSEEKRESWRNTLDRTPLRYFIPGARRPSNAELLLFKNDVEKMPQDLDNVTCKVLIMHGEKDDLVPPDNAVFAQKNLKHAKEVKLVWFKNDRHFIPWTKFTDIRDALLQLDLS
jgi:pimeloyl-ACP methyl ester carboxylesterase